MAHSLKAKHRRRLIRAIASGSLVTVRRRKLWSETIVPVAVGRRLLLFWHVHDFEVAGLHVIRLKDIKSVKRPRSDRAFEAVLRDRNQIPATPRPVPPLDRMEMLLGSIPRRQMVVLAFELPCDEPAFSIGWLGDLTKHGKRIEMRSFDVEGQLHDDEASHRVKRITRVQLQDPYLDGFRHFFAIGGVDR